MARPLIFLYGIIAYAIGMSSLFVFAAYLTNLIPGLGINSPSALSASSSPLVNIVLLILFGLQHSIMARPSFKKKWTEIIPKPMERSTYVLFSGVILWAIMLLWYPMPGTVWSVENPLAQNLIYVAYVMGWIILVGSSFLINHFDLFGLRQVYFNLKGKQAAHLHFVTPLLYKFVRHPIYFGFLLILWCAPTMSMSHFVMALGFTAYILFAVRLEEKDLITFHGQEYINYQQDVPMLIPKIGSQTPSAPVEAQK